MNWNLYYLECLENVLENLSAKEVADYLSVSEAKVKSWINWSKIPGIYRDKIKVLERELR